MRKVQIALAVVALACFAAMTIQWEHGHLRSAWESPFMWLELLFVFLSVVCGQLKEGSK